MVEYLTAIERRFGKGGCVPWIRTYGRHSEIDAIDPDVWSSRALQEGFVELG